MAAVKKATKTQAATNGKARTKNVDVKAVDRLAKNRITIPSLRNALYECVVVGTTPLIVHALGPKAKKALLASMGPKNTASKVRDPKDPASEYFDAMYILNNEFDHETGEWSNPHMEDQLYTGNIEVDYETILKPIRFEDCSAMHGVACAGIRAGMVRAARSLGAVMTDTRCNIRVESPYGNYLPITFETLVSGEDPVKVGNNKTDLRYRPYYTGWSLEVAITHSSDIIGIEELTQLLRQAGKFVGLGEWRNETDGQYGAYDVDLKTIRYEYLKDS